MPRGRCPSGIAASRRWPAVTITATSPESLSRKLQRLGAARPGHEHALRPPEERGLSRISQPCLLRMSGGVLICDFSSEADPVGFRKVLGGGWEEALYAALVSGAHLFG